MKLLAILALLLVIGTQHSNGVAPRKGKWHLLRSKEAVWIQDSNGEEVLRYQLAPPTNRPTAFESGCYFHPVKTPSGRVLTEVSPADHPHHRGIFLAWVE